MSGAPRFAVDRHRLPNGLTVFLLERRSLPLLSLTMLVPSGVNAETRTEAGLAHLTAALLPQGTATRDAVRLAEDVDALGASLGAHSDYDYSSVGLSCLARDAEAAISILAEVVTTPAFAEHEIERKRRDVLSVLERRKDDLVDRVRTRFGELMFGDHPYANPRLGYPESVAGLSSERVRGFYRTHYRPDEAMLAVVGDFTPSRMLATLTAAFGSWAAAPALQPTHAPVLRADGFLLDRIQKNDVSQATIRVGAPGFRRDAPEYTAAVLLNYVIGGSGFGSRLMKNLREEKGLTYGASSSFHTRKDAGYFIAGLQTGLATMEAALHEVILEVRAMRQNGVTEEELAWAKRYFTGSLPLGFQTNDQLATHVLEQALYDLEPEFWLREIERMSTATLAEVNAVAERYLTVENFTVVVLADFREHPLPEPSL